MTAAVQRAAPLHAHRHPAYRTGSRPMRVVEVRQLVDDVLHIRLADPDGTQLASFQPGSHLIVSAGDHRNAYSLVGDGLCPQHYEISVLRRRGGGGSEWLHHNLSEGSRIMVEGPRSMFAPVLDQRHALLVAGGIGVTPILSHARAAARQGRGVEIIYSYRRGRGAHLDDLRQLAEQPGIDVREVHGARDTAEVLAERLAVQPLGTHAYACGPPGFLESYRHLAREAGWPSARVHLERFTAPEQEPGAPFRATLSRSGAVIDVPAGVSLLEKLLERGVDVPNLCRQGVCGQCRIPVRGGTLTHRDLVLTDEEKATGDSMLCCVSRGDDIEVDL